MCSHVLPCPLCCKPNFESIDALKISLVKVTNRPLMCPICNEMLFGLDKLTIHLFSHSLAMDVDETANDDEKRINGNMKSPANQIIIPQSPTSTSSSFVASPNTPNTTTASCSSTSSPSSARKKNNKTSPACSIKCDICDFAFENQKHLGMHMSLVHEPSAAAAGGTAESNAIKSFPCHLCNKSFKMKGSLRVHLRVVHMHGFQNLCKDASKNKGDGDPQFMNPNNNINCGTSGIVQMAETEDRKCAAANEQKINQTNGIKQKEQAAHSPDQSKSWICDICTKSFTTKYFLKKHKRLHTGEMPYACTICGKTFTFQQSYHKHLLYHSDEKPHVCPTCGRAFKELSTLHNHERIHSGEKPFKCETCSKCFRQRVSYLVHRRIHDGTMPYKCTACAKSFRYKVSQRTHKCPAQPPGQVVRQSGELLQKLLQNSSLISQPPLPEETQVEREDDVESKLDAEERHRINEMIDQSIEDMARGKVDNIHELFPTPIVEEILGIPAAQPHPEKSLNSPSDQFQNLCLYSHDQSSLDDLNADEYKELLYTTHM